MANVGDAGHPRALQDEDRTVCVCRPPSPPLPRGPILGPGMEKPQLQCVPFWPEGRLMHFKGCIIASSSRAAVPDEPEMAQGWEGLSQNSP